MEIRTGSLTFASRRTLQARTEIAIFNFTQTVRQAIAGITGLSFGFTFIPQFDADHNLGKVSARVTSRVDDDVVIVEGTFLVRDWSGDARLNDGTIQFVLLVDFEPAAALSNLSVTGVEFSQAIQSFRSHLHLDPATTRPDNAVGLIAGKNTVLRVYHDTQQDPARPSIGMVSGNLEIRLPGNATWNAVVLLNSNPMSPKRDVDITRRNFDDTLNFFIPGVLCRGAVDFRVHVFEAAHPRQSGYTSARLFGTLRFTELEALRIRGVGVRYTGRGLNIAAPTVDDFSATLSFLRKTYPVGQIKITGYDVITDDGDYTDGGGDGCGDAWGDLLRTLSWMRGDTGDIYYAVLPQGVPGVNVGSIVNIGCGRDGAGVAAGSIFNGPIAAHEIGHTFGRDHAPCGGAPNQDERYPTFNAFPSGSIGEFGINDRGAVFDPALTLDFMAQGQCAPARRWVSP